MYKQYIKQALYKFKENKLLSCISILGSALAICIIMVIIILFEAKTADYTPEVNRSRMLYVKWCSAVNKLNENDRSFSRLSYRTVEDVFYPLKTPEAVTGVYSYGSMLSSIPAGLEEVNCDVIYTDPAFWRVFEFDFLGGKPFEEAAYTSGLKQAVINEATARRLYAGVQEAIGKPIEMNYVEYTICGVVRDVSRFTEHSYADVWLPSTTNSGLTKRYNGWGENLTGGFMVFMLARGVDDFPAIRNEVASNVARLNASTKSFDLGLMGQPDEFLTQMMRKFANAPSETKETLIRFGIIILIILIVPAINLSGLTLSGMQKRMSEIGVRKAFGATQGELLRQVLIENLVLTLIGGLLGLIFSYGALWLMSDWLLASDLGGTATMNTTMIRPGIFLFALAFCLVLNLLSAGASAWRTARMNITDALNQR